MSPRLALALLAITSSCQWACGSPQTGPVTPDTLGLFGADLAVCVRLNTDDAGHKDVDGGLACFDRTVVKFCGDGGMWQGAPAGVCDAGVF
jgi:hypothetical protein